MNNMTMTMMHVHTRLHVLVICARACLHARYNVVHAAPLLMFELWFRVYFYNEMWFRVRVLVVVVTS